MFRPRVIPVILIDNKDVVRTTKYSNSRYMEIQLMVLKFLII